MQSININTISLMIKLDFYHTGLVIINRELTLIGWKIYHLVEFWL
ncbi:hypothetical protein XBP1_400030 [Xenorhabdus bovienii str. puntauvense]|uniref:Uncharacterized protein n=1 Tax=Xenorhabdus bovienii str. puntauvense TaxID=1398201 RepID=A0A077N8V6_XENBV|nr:hypothetical protein XBP1_400030 [Xenorhabdus bovienii str. puntauvense]